LLWLNKAVNEISTGKMIDELVDEQMISKNLRIEVKSDNGKWTNLNQNNNK